MAHQDAVEGWGRCQAGARPHEASRGCRGRSCAGMRSGGLRSVWCIAGIMGAHAVRFGDGWYGSKEAQGHRRRAKRLWARRQPQDTPPQRLLHAHSPNPCACPRERGRGRCAAWTWHVSRIHASGALEEEPLHRSCSPTTSRLRKRLTSGVQREKLEGSISTQHND